MTEAIETNVFGLVLLFCRIGGCILLAPGLSSPRVPVQVRLFAAVGIAAALSPLILDEILGQIMDMPPSARFFLILQETAFGALVGLMARCFFMALQFAATAISNFIGLSGIPGIPLEEGDTGSPLATLASTAALAIVFSLGLHIELLKAVLESYSVVPVGRPITAESALFNLILTISETWLLALRLIGPFLLYGVVANLAIGLGNRFAQQISVYHATTGAVMLGGFLLLYLMWMDWILVFISAYGSWIADGGFAG